RLFAVQVGQLGQGGRHDAVVGLASVFPDFQGAFQQDRRFVVAPQRTQRQRQVLGRIGGPRVLCPGQRLNSLQHRLQRRRRFVELLYFEIDPPLGGRGEDGEPAVVAER